MNGWPAQRGHDVIWPRCTGPSVRARGPRPRAPAGGGAAASRDRGNAEGCACLVPSPRRPRGVRAGRGGLLPPRSVFFRPRGFVGGGGCCQMVPLQGGDREAGSTRGTHQADD